MNCIEANKEIDSLLDGEINFSRKEEVKNHLRACRSCAESFNNLQMLGKLLRQAPTPLPSARLDTSVMKAFHQKNARQIKQTGGKWRTIFKPLIISKLGFALIAVIFAAIVAIAFQLGRITATNSQSALLSSETVSQLPAVETVRPPDKMVENAVPPAEIPVTKFVKIPVIKEKIVTRVVYLERKPDKKSVPKIQSIDSDSAESALKSSMKEYGYLTQVNLKGFQPVSVIKVKIIKKGESNEN